MSFASANPLRVVVTRLACFLACGLAPDAEADSWDAFERTEYRSKNGSYLLEVVPHEEWVERPGHCRATLFRLERGDQRIEVWSRYLINNLGPANAFVADTGRFVVTMDEWHSVGELPVVIYGEKGDLIRVHSTDSLGLKDDVEHIKRTVSSYWWSEGSVNFFGPEDETLFIQLHWKKLLLLDLTDGALMDEDWYKVAKGWMVPEEKWESLHEYAKQELESQAK